MHDQQKLSYFFYSKLCFHQNLIRITKIIFFQSKFDYSVILLNPLQYSATHVLPFFNLSF